MCLSRHTDVIFAAAVAPARLRRGCNLSRDFRCCTDAGIYRIDIYIYIAREKAVAGFEGAAVFADAEVWMALREVDVRCAAAGSLSALCERLGSEEVYKLLEIRCLSYEFFLK